MFKQEDYIIQEVDDVPIENYNIIQEYRMNSQEFNDLGHHRINSQDLSDFGERLDSQDLADIGGRLDSQDLLSQIPDLVNLDRSLLPSPTLDETTMDISHKYEIIAFVPYSVGLNRIYVDMKQDFPVSFCWDGFRSNCGPLYVRTCTVFSDRAQAEKRVERCTQHTHEASNHNVEPQKVKNVLHSSRSAGTLGVYYCGKVDEPDSWYSVLVELPTIPSGQGNSTSHAYQFTCKNSCSSGINRRATDIIFTLEDSSGHVYGRQIVGARSCACPRRDMERDEEAEGVVKGTKRRIDNKKTEKQTKKIKLEVIPDGNSLENVVTLPSLEIVGLRPMITGLEVMLSMMLQAASLKKNDVQATEKYIKSISILRAKIDDLKKQL